MDQPHTATVLALDQRFFASASIEPGAGSLDEGINVHISLASPQFGELREYVFSSGRAGEGASLRAANSTAAAATNPYVELPLLYGLTLARALRERRSDGRLARSARGRPLAESGRGVRLVVDLAADNGFYSQVAELRARGLPLSAASLRSLPRLLTPRRAANGELAKTGLGSSATLVTSLVGALLQAAGVVRLPTAGGGGALTPAQRADLELLHALAQLCHCAAQGKVGSGFDATFGSQRYCRFSPAALEPVLQLPEGIPPPPTLLLAAVGAAAPSGHGSADAPAAPLDHQLQAFQLPPGVEVMMADVCCGAHTPSMVKRVQAWRASHPAAVELWPAYAAASARVQAALQRLVALHTRWASSAAPEEGWEDELARLGAMDQSEWAVEATLDGSELAAALDDLRAATIEMRGLVRGPPRPSLSRSRERRPSFPPSAAPSHLDLLGSAHRAARADCAPRCDHGAARSPDGCRSRGGRFGRRRRTHPPKCQGERDARDEAAGGRALALLGARW